MKTTDSGLQLLLGCIIVLIVAGATAGLFLTFGPDSPRYTYWLAMGDVIVLELSAGVYLGLILFLSTGARKSVFPFAMHLAIKTTLVLFFLASIVIDTLFLTAFDRSSLDRVFVWLVVWKWILMVATIAVLWFAGLEGRERKPVLEKSRERRSLIRSTMERARTDIRHLTVASNERATLRQATDDVESTYNRVKSWTSAPPAEADSTQQVAQLVDELARVTHELVHSPQVQREQGLVQVQNIAREISAHLGHK